MDLIEFELPVSGTNVKVVAKGDSQEILRFFEEKSKAFFESGAIMKRHFNQKLDEEKVREIKKIRREKGWGRTRLARKFKVGKTTIEKILNGETWKDVE